MQLASLVAASRLIAEQDAIAVIANNIANANTPAYQAQRTQFTDWLAPASAPAGEAGIAFVADRGTWRNRATGAFRKTGNPFDLAIGAKDAWFTVRTPQGVRLTRAGSFSLSANGTIVDQNGDPLLDTTGQPITLSTSDTGIAIAADGTVSSRENGVIGQISLVRPANPALMTATGGTLFAANGPTTPVGNPQLMQGMIEDSNVQPILEITRMITAEREFGFLAQFVQAESDRQQAAISKITTTSA
ncbi:MAG: flagellar hook basal-body protein [Rhodospirillales bacterium]|nr:flagellar hook basal-body protein [Rhodospirillales bacterium]